MREGESERGGEGEQSERGGEGERGRGRGREGERESGVREEGKGEDHPWIFLLLKFFLQFCYPLSVCLHFLLSLL